MILTGKQLDITGEAAVLKLHRTAQPFEVILINILVAFFAKLLDEVLTNLEKNASWTAQKISLSDPIFDDPDATTEELRIDFSTVLDEVLPAGYQLGGEALPIDASLLEINRPDLKTFQEIVRKRTSKIAPDIMQSTTDKIRKAILDGQGSVPETAKLIRESGAFSPARATLIARTEVTGMLNRGQVVAWEASGEVAKKQWYTALDERVCPVCMAMHEKIVGLDANFFEEGEVVSGTAEQPDGSERTAEITAYEPGIGPPMHPNCRCTLLPILAPA